MNSIKSIIFLCLLSFILSDIYVQDEYKCASKIKLDTCYLSTEKEDGKRVYYVDGCGKGKFCMDVGEVYHCVKP